MAERKLPARAAILAAGCIMFLFTGTIYAWSILSSPFPVEFGWTSAQLGLNFTIVTRGIWAAATRSPRRDSRAGRRNRAYG